MTTNNIATWTKSLTDGSQVLIEVVRDNKTQLLEMTMTMPDGSRYGGCAMLRLTPARGPHTHFVAPYSAQIPAIALTQAEHDGLDLAMTSLLNPAPRQDADAVAARRTINALLAKSDAIEDADYSRALQLRWQAARDLDAWRLAYPAAAADEDTAIARYKVADLRRSASDALTYDADGSISAAEQQRRHDDYMAAAEAIERSIA